MEEKRIFDLVLVKYGRFLVNCGNILVKSGFFLVFFGIDVAQLLWENQLGARQARKLQFGNHLRFVTVPVG